MKLLDSVAAHAAVGGSVYVQFPWKPIHAHSVVSTVFYGNNTYVFSVDKHREHYIFALNTSEPILKLTDRTTLIRYNIGFN